MSVFKKFKKKKIKPVMMKETHTPKVRKHISETIAWAVHANRLEELEFLIERHYQSSPASIDRLSLDEREMVTKTWSKIAQDLGIDSTEH
mgnify:CR=1 FL=1